MAGSRSGHAVVIGCGMGGIAAAAAVRRSFDRVTIFEKDEIPERPLARNGVPQSHQLHNLLAAGQMYLERLLPGFCAALREAGGVDAAVATETNVFELGVRMPKRDLGLRLMCASRPLLEQVARTRLAAHDNVRLQDRTRVCDIAIDEAGTVAGVRTVAPEGQALVPADLVIDAAGSTSASPLWLRERGFGKVPTVTLTVEQWYASCVFERSAEWRGRDEFWMVFPNPPATRGGLVSPIEGNRWSVSLSGRAGDRPPGDIAEFRAMAGSLDDPTIADLLAGVEPVDKLHLYRRPTAIWRRYDLLPRLPHGFLPLGDSIASLNPLFGQGITVAAWQAAELAALLADRPTGDVCPPSMVREYLQRAASACRAAWDLGALVGLPSEQPGGARPPRPEAGILYYQSLAELLEDDAALHRDYVCVWHLLKPASILLEHGLFERVNRQRGGQP